MSFGSCPLFGIVDLPFRSVYLQFTRTLLGIILGWLVTFGIFSLDFMVVDIHGIGDVSEVNLGVAAIVTVLGVGNVGYNTRENLDLAFAVQSKSNYDLPRVLQP